MLKKNRPSNNEVSVDDSMNYWGKIWFIKECFWPYLSPSVSFHPSEKISDEQEFKTVQGLAQPMERALLGGGCFWCTEGAFKASMVLNRPPAYAGGFDPNPRYEPVCSGTTGHAEIVEVVFIQASCRMRRCSKSSSPFMITTQPPRQRHRHAIQKLHHANNSRTRRHRPKSD